MVCNFSWLDGPNHPPFFMFSQSERHIKDRNGWIVQFSCLQSFTISFRIIWWQFRNTHCRLAFPKLQVWSVPAGLCCTREILKQDFSYPGLSPRARQSEVSQSSTVARSVPAWSTKQPSLGRDLPWHFMSPGRGAKRPVLKGSGEEGPGSHVLLQPSRWQRCHLELASRAGKRAQLSS